MKRYRNILEGKKNFIKYVHNGGRSDNNVDNGDKKKAKTKRVGEETVENVSSSGLEGENLETVYDANCALSSNMMIVGKPGQGKTTFVQNLALNGYIPSVDTVIWVAPSTLGREFKRNNSKLLNGVDIDVMYFDADDPESLATVIGEIEDVLSSQNDNKPDEYAGLGEQIEMSKNLANSSKELLHFMTTARKKSCSTISIFHTLLSSNTGKDIMATVNKLVLFSLNLSSQGLVSLLSNIGAPYESRKNVRTQSVKRDKNTHLLIEMDGGDNLVPNGPAIFRTNAAGKSKHVCYFPRRGNSRIIDSYCAERRPDSTIFDIVTRTVCLANDYSYQRTDIDKSYQNSGSTEKAKEKSMILKEDEHSNSGLDEQEPELKRQKTLSSDLFEIERKNF